MLQATLRIAVLPGDGIGPEVTAAAVQVLQRTATKYNRSFDFQTQLIGGAALKATGIPLPQETLDACLASNAVLLGAVGTPEFDANAPHLKPEAALLQLRKKLDAFANLRPAILHEPLLDASPLRAEIVKGVDVLIVRELTGGLYFGEPRGFGEDSAWNTMRYSESEIERIAHVAFSAARRRRGILHSIDKANVLETSQLWRRVVNRVAAGYPEVKLLHMYVDNCAMQLIANPRQFDVILTENLFGDILSDEAAMLTGSIGMLPSASLGAGAGIFEPVHGSAPDLAGKGVANPLAAIASASMMLRHSFEFIREADAVDQAIAGVLAKGYRTADIHRSHGSLVTTQQMADLVDSHL